MKKCMILLGLLSCLLMVSVPYTQAQEAKPAYVDAYRLGTEAVPHIRQENDSVYVIQDWYGMKGYDLRFVVTSYGDSTIIDLPDAGPLSDHYFYYVETGLPDLPIAGVSPGYFEPSETILSGFHGNAERGHVWSYVYLYTADKVWKGGTPLQDAMGTGARTSLVAGEGAEYPGRTGARIGELAGVLCRQSLHRA